jgi:trimeric autotransporter adhesin
MMTLNTARGPGKSLHRMVRGAMLLLVLQFQIGTAVVWANPSGEQVVAGQAGFDRAGSTLTVNQSTQRVVINWQDFSIQQGEVTKFLQPNTSALALNRVVGGNMSQIYGSLQANGKIILVNPNGMVFGSTGLIDVGSFTGSTLDLSNDVFMKGGDMQFVGDSKNAIQNFGKIQAQDDVFLFAQKIDNQGQVLAGKEASLAAGSNILLKQGGDNRVSVLVGSSDQVTGEGIKNSGEVQAAMVTMKATGSAYSAAVNNEGLIRATGAAKVGGRVLLTGSGGNILNSGTIAAKNKNGTGGEIKLQAGTNATKTATVVNSGTLDATGTTGGKVEVTGDRVALTDTALVDVSGTNGGGTALIGGGWQGKDADVQNADRTYVGTGARIKADAEETGDGGKVVVWADSSTTYQGSLSAKGGSQSGNGGFAEVSGKEVLAFTGTVDLGAANGSKGTLLLDPKNIIIDNAGPAILADVDAFADTSAATSNINAATINAAGANSNVILQANTDITQNAGAVINFVNANVSLTMQAGRSIILNDEITLNGTGIFTATINDPGAVTDRDAGLATFSMTALSSITTAGGAVTVNVGNLGGVQTGVVSLAGATIATSGGAVSLFGNAQTNNAVGVNIATSSISTGAGNLTVTGTGGTTFDNNGVTFNQVTVTGSGGVSITGASGTGTGFNTSGVLLGNETTITQMGTGSVTIAGTARGAGNASLTAGVLIEESDISVVDGNLQVTGTGTTFSTTGGNNRGVSMVEDAGDRTMLSSSGTGTITVTGAAGSGNAGGNNGVAMVGALVQSTGGGAILLQTGAAAVSTGGGNRGIALFNDSDVTATGSGTVTINGTSGVGSGAGGANTGVEIAGAGVSVTVVNGNLSINGTAASSGGSGNDGVFFAGVGTGVIGSTGTGLVNVTGTTNAAGSSTGINLNNGLISSTTSNITLIGSNTAGGTGAVVQQAGADITSTSGNISITASGATTDFLQSGGAGTTINAGSGNVSIVADTMTLGGSTITTGNVALAQFTNGRLIDLGADTAGRLALTSAELNTVTTVTANSIQIGNANSGNILIAGAIAPTGTNTLILQTGGVNTITQGAGFTITETNLGLQAGTGAITLTEINEVTNLAANTTGNLSLRDATGINIGTAATVSGVNTGAGVFSLQANGNVTQTQSITTALFGFNVSGGNDVILNDVNNAISTTGGLANDISITNSIAIDLNGITTSGGGNFSLTTSDDNVTSSAITVTGTTTINTGNGSVTMTNVGNNLVGAISLNTSSATGAVQITNNATAGTVLAASTVGGDLIIVQRDGTNATITQTGALTVGGQASFTNEETARGDVTVDNTGAVGGTVLGAGTTTVAGDYTLAASAGGVTQTGAVRVRGTLTTTGGTTTLSRDDNILPNAASLSGGSIYFRKIGVVDINTDISGTINTGSGSLTIISLEDGQNFTSAEINGTAIDLGGFSNNFGGGLVVNTGGTANTFATVTGQPAGINQNTATLTVGGTATFQAIDGTDVPTTVGAININGTNSLTGPISFTGQNATLVNSTATNLAASVLTGNLSVTSTGNITNSGILNVTGTSNFVGTTAGNTIAVNNAGNLLTGAVSFTKTGGGNVILNNNQATVLGNVTTNGGDFSVTSNGALTQAGGTSIVQNTGGALNVTTTAGNAVLTSTTNNILALNNVNAAADFQFYDSSSFNVTGTLTSTGFTELGTATGTVAQTAGTITSNGLLLTNNGAGTSTFTINQAGNAVVTLAGQQTAGGNSSITFINDGGFAIGTVNAVSGITAGTGNINLTSSTGAITRAGSSAVNMGGGTLTLTADTGVGTAGTPILTTGTHTLTGSAVTSGGFFTQNDTSGNVTVGGSGISAPGSIRVNNTFGSLTVNQAIDSTGGGNITLDSGTTMTVAAAVGSATANNITINNAGLFDSNAGARLTTGAAGVLNFSGAGQIGVSAADAALVSTGDVNFNRTTATSDAFVSNDTVGRVRGNINGNLDFRSTGGNDITIGNTTGPQNLTMGANGAPSSITVIASGQILSAGTIFANGADVALQGSQVGTSSVVPLVLNGVNILEARATGGGIFLSHSGSNLTVGEVSTALAGSGMSATGNIELNQGANQTITIANNIATPGNINVIIAFSGPGADQLFVNPGVTVGSGAGGSIIIGGGVNNQGNVTATAGSTTTLDGGRPNLTLGGIQNFNGDVTFSVIGDIEVTGRITQTSATGSITLISDSDLNNTGGIIITNEVDNDAFIKSAGTMNMTASQLFFTGLGASGSLGAGNYDNVGIGIAVLRNNTAAGPGRDLIIVGGATGSGDITMTTRPAAAPITVSDIIIEGVVQNNVAGTNISLDSSDQIQIGDNVTSVNNLNVRNEGSLTRTTSTATLRTGGTGTLLFEGAGQLGDLLGNSILTRAGNIDFDSSSGTKGTANADAFISEFDGVGIIGELDILTMTAAGTVTDIGLLDINQASIVTTSGSIVLNNFVHNIDQFNVMTAVNNIFYTGGVDLILADAVSTNASGTVTINVVGQNLNQLAAGHITSNNITLVMDTGTLNATIDRAAGATTTPAANVVNITNTGLLTTSGVTARISANTLNVDGSGDVGNNLSDGLNTSVGTLVFDKTDGDLYIFENTAGVTSLTGNMGANDTLNVSTATGNINVGIAGINTGVNTNVHLIAAGSGTSQVTQTPGGFINMDGGELLLVARNGIGIGTTSGAIQTTGEYTLAALNTGTSGGVFVINQDGTTTSGTDNVTIGSITAFTPASPGAPGVPAPAGEIAFDGVRNQSTATTGFRDIAINNNAGNIILSDEVTVANSNQNVQLVANEATVNGRIIQGLAAGVVNSRGGRVLLVGDSGVGEVNNAIHINGNSRLTAQSVNGSGSNIGGIYITNLNTTAQPNGVSATGTVTIGSATDIYTSTTFNGLQTLSAAADADIRLRNAADPVSTTAGPSSIVVDDIVQASVGFGGNTVALIADNGSILQGTGGLGRIVSDDNAGVAGEVLLAASRGIGTLATPLIVQGHYNLGFRNDGLVGFTIPGGVVSGNVNILNNAVGPISGFGNITVTQVNDVFTGAGVGVNLAITPTVGGRNFADAANSGAIRLRNTNTGADTGDIFIANTTVSTTGTTTGTAFIEIQAEDDVLVVGEASAGNVTTANGSITMIAGNANASDTDGVNGLNTLLNADGIYIGSPSANSTTLVQSGGTAGAMTLTATANLGRVRVSGGDTASATTLVQSSGDMTINATGAATGPGNVTATDSSAALLVQGGSANAATATINSTNTGATAQTLTLAAGGLRIEGGTALDTSATVTTAGTQTATVTGVAAVDSILILGGTGQNASATLSATTGTGNQSITLTNGNMVLLGGNGLNADANVTAAGTTQGITVSNGNLLVTANQNAVNANSDALIDSTNNGVTQTINVSGAGAGLITIQGGAGTTETAGIRTNGIQSITAANGISVNGGSGQDSTAFIVKQGDINDTQNITVTVGNFAILGGTGVNADANVTSNGLTQTINVNDGALTVQADQTAGGTANADALVSLLTNAAGAAVQTINVTNGGITVRGGVGATENATISMLDADGRQRIRLVTDGDLLVEGGNGATSTAFITSAGLNGVGAGNEAQNILIDAGQFIVRSNQDAVNGGSIAIISQTNTGAASQIITVNGLAPTDGTMSLFGGAGLNEGLLVQSAGTVAQTITLAQGLTILGGSGSGSFAGILSTGTGQAQSVTVTTGDATLTGGTGSGSFGFINQLDATGTQAILISGASALSNLTITGGNGLDADAAIATSGVTQTITVSNGNLLVTANQNAANANSDALVQASNNASTQTISVSGVGAGTLALLGGAGTNERAQILGNGIQGITVANGITVTGGSGTDTTADITKAGDATDTQTITVTTGDFAILGGTGSNANAGVNSNGVTQTINVNDGALTVQGDQTNAATANGSALVSATNLAAVQTLNVTNGGILVRGGVGTTEGANIQMVGVNGRQTINLITDGDLVVEGGNGTTSVAQITSAGLNALANQEAQRIIIDAGQLIVRGNQNNTNNNSSAIISQTNTGAASQIITVNGLAPTDGTVSVLGGAGVNELALISSAGNVAQTITIAQGLTITGGSGTSSTAGILSTGTGQAQTVVVTTGDANLTGGTGTSTAAFIDQTNTTGTQVVTISGASALSDLILNGGNGTDADARITAAGTVQTITVSNGDMSLTANQDAANTSSDALVRATNNASTQTITVSGAGAGTLALLGGAGTTELAQIFANGIQGITVANGITVTGGSGSNSTADIIKTGDATDTQTITVTTGDFAILGGTGSNASVSVQSNGVTQTINVNDGALTVQGDQTNAATANASALVSATNTNAVQTLNVTNGGILVRGGVGTTEGANIQMVGTDGRQTINLITDGDLVVEGGDGATSVAQITSAGLNAGVGTEAQRIIIDAGQLIVRGNQNNTNNNSSAIISQTNTGAASQIISVLNTAGTNGTDGTVLIEGGDGTSEIAQILSNGTVAQTITIARGLTMQGGDGNDSTALITSTGTNQAQRVTVTTGNATLTGGTANNTQARIEQTNAVGTQLVEVLAASAASNLALLGGTGINADAAITAAGTTQTLTVSNGALTVQADQTTAGTANADALVEATNTNAIQLINVTNGGIIVRGGVGTTETARIAMTGTSGRQTINLLTDGDFVVEGGDGATSTALVTSAGLNAGVGTEAQRIVIDAGQLIVRGNQNATNNDSTAIISQTNTGSASQIIAVNGLAPTDGTVSVLGGAGLNELALISSSGNVAQTITIAQGLTVTGGSGNNSTAGILSTGTGQAQSVVVTTGNASLTGGTGNSTTAFIDQTDATGTQVVTVSGASALSNLALTGGNGIDSDARISADGTAQTITISNGNLTVTANQNAANPDSDAVIQATNNASTQTISVSGVGAGTLSLLGGAGTNERAQILGNGVQGITVANGITVTGGSGTNSTADITKAGDATDTQTITVTTGDFAILGGTGINANAGVNSNGVTQLINVNNGALTVQGDQTNAATANGSALVSATNNTAVQTLNVTNGGILVRGGVGTTEGANIQMVGNNGRQTINLITNGDLVVEGGDGTTSLAQITSAGLNALANQEAQRIIIDAGQLIVRGNQSNTNNNSSAIISQTNGGAASQIITVNGLAGTDGTVSVLGGAGVNELALITSAGTVAQTLTIARGLTITGGSGNNSAAGIRSTGNGQAQSVIVTTGDALITGGTGSSTAAFIDQDNATGTQVVTLSGVSALSDLTLTGGNGNDSDARISSAGITQSITVTNGDMSLTANQDAANNNSDASVRATNNASTQTISVSGAGAGTLALLGGAGTTELAQIFANGIQGITVANGITVTGGSGTTSTADIIKAGDAADTQTITVTTGNFAILGGTGNNANVSILSNGVTQLINVNNGALTVQGDQTNAGSANGSALISATNANAVQTLNVTNGGIIVRGGVGTTEGANIQMVGNNGRQTINLITNGDLLVEGGNGTTSVAQITSAGVDAGAGQEAQRIIIDAGQLIVRGNQNAANNDSAAIVSQTNAGAASQIITVSGAAPTDGTVSVLGGSGINELALISSAGSVAQTLTIAQGLTVTGGSGVGSSAGILATGSDQTVTVNAGNANLTGGTAANARAFIDMTSAVSDQTISVVAGNLNLNDGTGADAVILSTGTSATGQVITTSGTTNLSGTDGFQSLISGVNTTLNNAGGTWAGRANVVSTVQASINNTGAIVIDESSGFTGGVTTPLLRFFGGTATVGTTTNGPLGASTRLNTFVDQIFFDAVGAKTVNISEADTVDLRGTIGTVNLITDNAGNIVTNIAALNATNATFQTFDGDIDLDGVANNVANFRGVVARDNNTDGTGGNFNYLGASNTTVRARAVSAEIAAGEDIFATNTITMDVGGNNIILAGGTKIAGTGPGAGDGTIFSGSNQTYQSAIILNTDYFITSDGSGLPAADNINFNGTIDGPGGLGIGSTPNFNANVGANTPLAYLVLNSPLNSNFNANNGFVVTNGSIVNQGGGNFNINGTNMTFIVDAGTVGPGPGVFAGGTMVNTSGTPFTLFAASPDGVSGNLIVGLPEVFDIWTVSSPGVFDISAGTLGSVNFKTPNPFDPLDPFNKNRLVKRRVNIRYDIAYQQGGLPAGYYTTAGVPDVPNGKVGGLMSSSYEVNVEPIEIDRPGFVDLYQTR